MKKLLSLLAATTLVTSTSIAVIACNPANIGEVTSLAQQLEVKTRFIADVNQVIIGHVNSQNKNLIQSDKQAENNLFLNKNLGDLLAEGETSKQIVWSHQNKDNANTDLRSLLKTAEIGTLIDNLVAEKKEYQFLVQGMDQIFAGLSVGNMITVTDASSENTNVFTGKFDVTITWQYSFNGAVETETTTINDLIYNVATDQTIVDEIQEIVETLPSKIYNSVVGTKALLFNHTDTSSINTKWPFSKQTAKIGDYYAGDEVQETLKDKVNAGVKAVVDSAEVEFNYVAVNPIANLYSASFEHVIQKGGFFEQTLLKKIEGTTPTSISTAFDNDFADYLNKSVFDSNARKFVEENYNISIEEGQGFIEYGTLSLGGGAPIKVNYGKDLSIEINPINLIYTYNTEKDFATELSNLFVAWQNHWGVVKSNDPGAMFAVSKSAENGSAFWGKINGGKKAPFSSINAEPQFWYDPFVTNSNFYSFWLDTTDSGLDSNGFYSPWGFTVDYTSYFDGKPSASDLDNSFKLIVNVDDVRITINFAKSVGDYLENFMYGYTKQKPIIQLVK